MGKVKNYNWESQPELGFNQANPWNGFYGASSSNSKPIGFSGSHTRSVTTVWMLDPNGKRVPMVKELKTFKDGRWCHHRISNRKVRFPESSKQSAPKQHPKSERQKRRDTLKAITPKRVKNRKAA